VILFDGVCNLCSGAVQFVLKRDKKKRYKFASLQGEAGQALLYQYGLPLDNFNSFVLVENGKVLTKSNAALEIAKHLSGGWKLLSAFRIIPSFIRDGVYRLIASNRYKWFGKKESCWIPTPELRARFLD
jgi:predicted DCC family thiol-disulfide oxidoreductase YuxK